MRLCLGRRRERRRQQEQQRGGKEGQRRRSPARSRRRAPAADCAVPPGLQTSRRRPQPSAHSSRMSRLRILFIGKVTVEAAGARTKPSGRRTAHGPGARNGMPPASGPSWRPARNDSLQSDFTASGMTSPSSLWRHAATPHVCADAAYVCAACQPAMHRPCASVRKGPSQAPGLPLPCRIDAALPASLARARLAETKRAGRNEYGPAVTVHPRAGGERKINVYCWWHP